MEGLIGIGAIVGGALGLGGSLLSSRSQSRAADRAATATENASREQVALARDIYNQQRQDLEPFRQQELARANALGEVFGFAPVGQSQPNPQPQSGASFSFPGFSGANFQGMNGNNRGFVNLEDFGPGEFYARPDGGGSFGSAPGRVTNSETTTPTPTMEEQQNAARERFEGSMFMDAFNIGRDRDESRINSGLAAQGLAFSGANLQAQADATADRYASTFNSYMSALMGQAPQTATANTNNAAANFASGANAAIAQRGAGQAQSAYARGDASAGVGSTIAGMGGFLWGRDL